MAFHICPRCGKSFPRKGRGKYCSFFCRSWRPVEERLWARLKISDSGCWEWQGGKDQDGYGALRWGWEQRAHRVAYWIARGSYDRSLQVLHTCDNPACCNPNHLFLGTAADNNRDMVQKGRAKPGNVGKLSSDDVRLARRLVSNGVSQRQVGFMLGISWKQIWKIVHGQSYKHV